MAIETRITGFGAFFDARLPKAPQVTISSEEQRFMRQLSRWTTARVNLVRTYHGLDLTRLQPDELASLNLTTHMLDTFITLAVTRARGNSFLEEFSGDMINSMRRNIAVITSKKQVTS